MTNELIGKNITAVYIAQDRQALRFDTDTGESLVARVDGDCCSHTWIEGIEGPERMLGIIRSVEDIYLPNRDYETDGYEVIAFYGAQITTENGSAVIDYRNSSNGYYGGSIEWPGSSYYYGGVFGQNMSNENWELIAGEEGR